MKKIISILCSVLLAAGSVSASVMPDNQNEDTIIISGKVSVDEGEKVTLTVFPHEKGFDSEGLVYESPSEIPSYINTAKADSNGNVSFNWKTSKSGFYDIYYSANDEIKVKELNVYFPYNAGVLYDKIRNGSLEELKTELSGNGRVLDLVRNKDEADAISPQKLASAIFNIREASSSNDTEKIILAAKNLTLLASKKNADTLDSALKSLEDAEITLPFITGYNTYATSDIKSEMALNLSDICEIDVSQLNNYLNNSFILAGVYKSPNWMDCVNFLKILGYPSGDKKINKAANSVAGTKYNTITSLKSAIDDAVFVSGGGGGAVIGGNTTPSRIDATKPDVKVDADNVDVGAKQDDVFSDVKNTHYAFDDINYLRWHQVVSGDDKGNFNPDSKITRAEVLKMLCEVFGIEGSTPFAFDDVDADSWFASFVGGAYNAELIKGGDDGKFNPNEYITRQDLAVMLYRFCVYSGFELEEGDITFADKDDISDYALSAVSTLCLNGIINGMDDNTFLPFEGATRAQTACMLARYMRNFNEGGV